MKYSDQIKGHSRRERRWRRSWGLLKLCVVQGVQACNIGIPILADKLERVQQGAK